MSKRRDEKWSIADRASRFNWLPEHLVLDDDEEKKKQDEKSKEK